MQGTHLRATDTTGSVEIKTALIRIQGTGIAASNESYHPITTPYVPAGACSFEIDNASPFDVGDDTFVRRPSTETWIQRCEWTSC